MSLSQTTFWSLLHSYGVRIPIIQRDYAQGREDAAVIRNKFVHSLHQALQDNDSSSPLDLDFVYGEVINPDDPTSRYLIPLDGQQRLTTLYLLHWYLAVAENRLDIARPLLRKFTYQTRSSSREFCRCLAECEPELLALSGSRLLSEQLYDAVWFQPAWQRDPTVRGMLTMLDSLAEKFGQEEGLFDRLTNSSAPLVSFQFLDLKKAGLTDDLYLKMNARGKALTDFENWKAEFDQFLIQHHPARQAEFALKVDGAWTDLFWQHRKGDPAQMDVAFKRFLDYITAMLSQLPGAAVPLPDEGADPFARYRLVYANPAHVKFLFESLDLLSQPTQNAAAFFDGLLSATQTDNRVVIFNSDTNLFARVIDAPKASTRVRVLLFTVLLYGVSKGSLDSNDSNLQDLVRVIRNQIERNRQLKKTDYKITLGEDDVPVYLADLVAFVSKENGAGLTPVYGLLASNTLPRTRNSSRYAHEVEKARLITQQPHLRSVIHKLEDLPVFRGNLKDLAVEENSARLSEMAVAAKDIWVSGVESEHIIRAWFTIGDYSLHTGSSALGYRYYLGSHDNWHPVLVARENRQITPFLLAYAEATGTTPTQRLQWLAAEWLAGKPDRDFRYYFVKYPSMAQNSTGQFTWQNDYQIRLLGSSSLRANHINPYVQAVVRMVNDESKCTEAESSTNEAIEWPLRCRQVPSTSRTQNLRLYCRNEGWLIKLPKGYALDTHLARKYGLDANRPCHITELPSRDRVQTAVAFIKDLYEYGLVKLTSS